MGMGNFGERAPIVKYRDFLPCAVQKKQLNRSICRLFCIVDSGEPKEAQFQSYRQVAPMCPPVP